MRGRTRIRRCHLTVIITAFLARLAFTSASPSTNHHGPNGIYNPSVASCPNNPSFVGYATLSSLRSDLSNYFLSLTTSPTISPAPTPSPSATPTDSPSGNPTPKPTNSPSEIPTKAPITFRPTKFPISAIFANKRPPTKSPSPTIEVVVLGVGGEISSGPGGRDRALVESPAPSPRASRDLDGQGGEERNRFRRHKEPLSRGDDILASQIGGKSIGDETATKIGDKLLELATRIGDETAGVDSNLEKPPDLRGINPGDLIGDPDNWSIADHEEALKEEWREKNPSEGDKGTQSTPPPPLVEYLVAAPFAVNEETPDEMTADTGPTKPAPRVENQGMPTKGAVLTMYTGEDEPRPEEYTVDDIPITRPGNTGATSPPFNPNSEINHKSQSMEALYEMEALAEFATRDHDDTGHLLEDGELVTFNICPDSQFSFDDAADSNDGP
eukprot:CAMPEP_0196160342 /NCGR_PEP_ID=MMETSP0910-20130528/46778_1 /TAXON_ID=49265 /ORGANISM="Thalassiosira rotula, Strain GSO102" /LENGTH=441 /DNA_ID=CAMNT_0041425273 /DNA_START=241 /DNA_END=1564 /DNA_ORIENTATION=-